MPPKKAGGYGQLSTVESDELSATAPPSGGGSHVSIYAPGGPSPEQLQRTTAYFANLREQRGRPHHELRPGELPAPHVRHPLHSFDDVIQAVRWHDRQDRMREEAAQALQEGQLHEPPGGHPTLPATPASSEVYSLPESRPDGGPSGLGQSRTPSYTYSSRGGSADSFS